MTAPNKQALREAAQEEIMLRSVSDTSDAWQDEASPEAVLALLDELEAAERRIAEQSKTLMAARSYVKSHAAGDGHAFGVLQAIDRAAGIGVKGG
ncbi:ead/Ea22-like family protein [Escherichia coli]|uniref:ead/Ea22-like family protein n=1 Tax=Escherichia coli TaxID=562 RepID=UPI000BE6F2D6|nr:ead/Ea22-like family protein [Escherichia coli]MBB9276519.1 ead/Ea22-like family protein [Escherichia coli]